MMWLESLTPNRRFTADSKRSPSWEATDSSRAQQQRGADLAEIEGCKSGGNQQACRKAADGAGPGLLRADPRPQFRSADAAPREISRRYRSPRPPAEPKSARQIPRPGQGAPAPTPATPRPHRQSPPPTQPRRVRREQRSAHEAQSQGDERRLDPADRQAKSGHRERRNARRDHAAAVALRPTIISHSHKARSPPASPARPTTSRRHRRMAIVSGASTNAATTRISKIARPRLGDRPPARLRPRSRSGFRGQTAKTALPPGIFGDRALKRRLVEIRPMDRHEHQFAVGRLPHQEIRQPLFAAGANDQIGIGNVGRIEILAERVGIDRCRIALSFGDFARKPLCRCGDFLPRAVVERDDEMEAAVVLASVLRPPSAARRYRAPGRRARR